MTFKLSAECRVMLLVVAIGVSACAPSPRQRPILMSEVPGGTGSLVEARKYLEGRWTLQSYEVFPPDQAPIRLNGTGTLTYDQFGNLEIEVRADKDSVPFLSRAGIETTNGVLATKGRTAVDMQAHTLTYMLEGQPPLGAPSGPLALNRPRYWQVDGNVLTLTTKDDQGKPTSVGRWMKEQ
jgi:hypothetical protein